MVKRDDNGVMRDAKGRFVKGHSGNPNGRGRKSDEELWLQRLHACVTPLDFEQMIRVGLSRAKAGDSTMLRLFLQYLIGMPTQYVKQDIEAETQNHITIEYVNDWRENPIAVSASRTDSGQEAGEAV